MSLQTTKENKLLIFTLVLPFISFACLVLAIEVIGLPKEVHIPEKTHFDSSKVFPRGKVSGTEIESLKEHNTKLLTLYNIENSLPLNRPSRVVERFVLCGLCSVFATYLALFCLYLALFHKEPYMFRSNYEKGQEDLQNGLTGRILPVFIFAAFAWLFGSMSFSYYQCWYRYDALKSALQNGKCKILAGNLADVKFHKVGHGSLDLNMLEVSGHQFCFPANRDIEAAFFNGNDWMDEAPSRLQPNVRIRVWYTTIDGWDSPAEHVARLDVD